MQTIKFEIENTIATITLNRPNALNSFNVQMHQEVQEAMKTVKRDETIRCLLLTGSGKAFCAGQDLSDRTVDVNQAPVDLGDSLKKWYNPLVKSIVYLEKPVVCAVNGVAAGAGVNLALACDIVLAARSSYFIQAFSQVGLMPDCGGTWVLPRLLGPARARVLSMLAEKISAEKAENWGMIWRCIDDQHLYTEARGIAQQLAQGPTYALGMMKRALHASQNHSLNQQLDMERDLQRLLGRSDDYREGTRAFMEKRKPKFTGK